ncbi:hypothetical protein ACFT5B_18620 [Luteimicrobium sp. NPDC057192]|uniref:hypothetical protein n=1 Tax=Luteimicrobium sp. NPDC057192 TaxID=3346042 RepID=UPI00362A6461
MASVQVSRASRMWAFGAAAALAGTTALVAAPAASGTEALSSTTAAVASGAVVAPTSATVLTGHAGLTDDAVYGETASGIVSIPRGAVGADWTPVSVGGTQLAGHLLQAEGDALLVADLDGKSDTLAWRAADGAWSVRSVPNGTTLGRGGLYALLPPGPGASYIVNWPIEDVSTGTITVVHLWAGLRGVAVDGSSLWTTNDLYHGVDQYELPSKARLQEINRLDVDDADALSVSGRWALFTGADARVVDLQQVYADLDLGPAGVHRSVVLGARTISWLSGDTVTVQELAGTRATRSVGTSRYRNLDDDDQGTTLAYVDPTDHVRLVDLSWATAPRTTIVDRVAPSVPLVSVGNRALNSTTISVFAYPQGDGATPPFRPSGATAELRYRQHKNGSTAFGAWVGVAGETATLIVPRDSTTCFQARARDKAGNVSAWSGAECAVVDSTAPRLAVHGPSSGTKSVHGKARVTVSYSASDATRVRNYDVRYKKAPKGSTTYGSWVYPAGWQGTTVWSPTIGAYAESITIATGQRVCFSVRARDVAGNVSAWSSSRCSYADAAAPRLTKVVGPPRWYGVPTSGKVRTTVRFAGWDDHALRFDVQIRTAGTDEAFWGWMYVARATTARSFSYDLPAGHEACYRVRARDTAGHVSAWSKPRCTNVAASGGSKALYADRRTTLGGTRVAMLRSSSLRGTTDLYAGAYILPASSRGIRVQVRTCRTCGTLIVQIHNSPTFVSLVSARPGWRYVKVTWKPADTPVSLYEAYPHAPRTTTTTYLRSWSVIR